MSETVDMLIALSQTTEFKITGGAVAVVYAGLGAYLMHKKAQLDGDALVARWQATNNNTEQITGAPTTHWQDHAAQVEQSLQPTINDTLDAVLLNDNAAYDRGFLASIERYSQMVDKPTNS